MLNIDIIKNFDVKNMACFLACTEDLYWNDQEMNAVWLNSEAANNILTRNGYIWDNYQWERPEGYDASKYKHCGCWPLEHIYEILEAVLETQTIESYNVIVVIPTIEYRAPFDDFKDVIKYKGINFHVWSDFYDLHLCKYDDEEAARVEAEYMANMTVMNYTHPELVNSIKVYFRNKK